MNKTFAEEEVQMVLKLQHMLNEIIHIFKNTMIKKGIFFFKKRINKSNERKPCID